MQWGTISTRLGELTAAQARRQRVEALVVCLYARALRLYPAAFRADFAEEMAAVFAMSLREAGGLLSVLLMVLREFLDLPTSILQARQQGLDRTVQPRTIWRARQITRLASTIISFVILNSLATTIMAPEAYLADARRLVVFFLLLLIIAVSMLLAWRWERQCGLVMMGCSVGLGAFLTFYIGYFHPPGISTVGLILIGVLWMLPFFILGLLFHNLSRYPKTPYSYT